MQEIYDNDELWKMADLALEECNESNESNESNQVLRKNKECKHEILCEGVCSICGICVDLHNISNEGEWNNYRDESGGFAKNMQRCDTYVDTNPYSTGGTLLPFNNKNFISKLQIQNTFSHKQKTYWQVGEEIENIANLLHISDKTITMTAKNYWHQYMESGKLTRASVRKGLIAACLYYSCIQNNSPIERYEIIRAFNCDTKTLSKGEKVLFEILDTQNLTYINVQTEDTNSFVRYCSLLKLKYSTAKLCNDINEKYKIQLQAVTPKSATGGIIAYVVKYILKEKTPTKTVISATVDVCTPTLNKVIQMIYNLEN